MHVVDLQVIASVRIKRKKPWRRFAWIGKAKESVLMLEDHRVSILFVPSGNTKRKISKLSPMLKDCVSLNYTQNGSFVFGLLQNGTIFAWNKDTNVISHISTIPDLQLRTFTSVKWRPLVFMDESGVRVVVIVITPTTTVEIFVWNGSPLSVSDRATDTDHWWRIEGSNVDSRGAKELASDVCFVCDNVLGNGARCAFVFTRDSSVSFVALSVDWATNRLSPIVHHWANVAIPIDRISPTALASKRKGAYVVRLSRDACIAAVVVNQDVASDTRIIFVSVNCEVLVVSRLYTDDRERYDDRRFLHWICDAAWMNNDLFLVAVNRLGSVCLVSRLGEPLTIGTHGCSMDLSPAQLLSIHPFVFVRNSAAKTEDDSMTTTSSNVLKQRFSICCHPRLPVFLCSDGYLVTCLQLPNLLADPHRAVYVFLREAQKNLKLLKKLIQGAAVTPPTKTPKSECAFRRSFGFREPTLVRWEKSQSDEADSSVEQSESVVHRYSEIGKANQGVLSFGTLNSTSDLRSTSDSNDVLLSDALSDVEKATLGSLLCAWSIVVSTKDTWTIEWETRAKNVTELLVKLCTLYTKQSEPERVSSSVKEIVMILDRFLLFCRFDGVCKNTMAVVIAAVRTIFGRVLMSAVSDLPPQTGAECLDAVTALLSSISDTIVSTFSWKVDKMVLYQVGKSAFDNVYSATSRGPSRRKVHLNVRRALGGRLITIWRRLYRVAKRIYLNLDSYRIETDVAAVLGRIQAEIQLLGHSLEKAKRVKVTAEQKQHLLVASDHDVLVSKWWQEAEKILREDGNATPRASKLLHSILYSHLEGSHLGKAIGFVYQLVALNGISGLKHRAIQLAVRSFARFMGAYFAGIPLAIYPWHRPRPLPLPTEKARIDRFISIDRSRVVSCLKDKYVADHWSVDVSVALLLSTGCLNDAADLARRLGDWKSSFVISVADSLTKNKSTTEACGEFLLAQACQMLGLQNGSDGLTLHGGVSDNSLPSALEECFLAGVLCGFNIVPSVCKCLSNELKILARKLDSVLVPEDIYVPRPPIYCPQLKDPSVAEDHVVARIASIVHLVRIVLCSSHCRVQVVHAYLSELNRISQMASFDEEANPIEFPLHDMLRRLEDQLNSQAGTVGVSNTDLDTMVQCLRDICSVSWFINVRDKTSRYFRKFRQNVEAEKSPRAKVMSKTCIQALEWAFHLLPFADFMDWHLDVYDLMLSVLLEMPADEKASAFLAKCFPDMTQIPDELNYRINRLLTAWRMSIVEIKDDCSVRSKRLGVRKTLSVIHLEQCLEMKNNAVHLNVAVGSLQRNVLIGEDAIKGNIRPFELEKDYYEFLELMFDVGFLKDGIDDEEVPLFTSNVTSLVALHLTKNLVISKKNVKNVEEFLLEAAELTNTDTSKPKRSSRSGLFRSLSLSDLQMKVGMPSSLSRTLNTDKGTSLTNIYKKEETLRCPPLRKPCGPVFSICSLCDSFLSNRLSLSIGNPRIENLKMLMTWLVSWAEKDDRVKGKRSNGPRIKVRLNVAQLLSAVSTHEVAISPVFSQVDHLEAADLDSSDSNWSPTEVTPRDFFTSTPVHAPVDSTSRSKLLDTFPRENVKEMSPRQLVDSNDLISEYFKRLQLYQHSDDNSSFDSSMLEISSLSLDANNRSGHSSPPSVSRDRDESSEYEDPSLVTISSRWTNGNRTESKDRVGIRGKPSSVHDFEIKIMTVSQPTGKGETTREQDKKTASMFVSSAVQVHEASLLENQTVSHSVYSDHSDDTLNEVASPDTSPSPPKQTVDRCRLVRRDAVKRVRRKREEKPKKGGDPPVQFQTLKSDSKVDNFRVRLLRLPAEKELCLLDVGRTLNKYPEARKKDVSLATSNGSWSIPPLLHLEKSLAPFPVYEKEPVKLLSPAELLKYETIALSRSKSSTAKPPIPTKPLKFNVVKKVPVTESVEKNSQQVKVDVGVGTSSVNGYFMANPIRLRDAHTITEDPIQDPNNSDQLCKSQHRKNSVNAMAMTELVVRESKSVGVETTNGLSEGRNVSIAKEDKATSPIVAQDEDHGNGNSLSHLKLHDQNTQTDLDVLVQKESVVVSDSQTNTEAAAVMMMSNTLAETTRSTTADLTVDDSVWKSRLNGAGQSAYQKIKLMHDEAKMMQNELSLTKKCLERLDLLEQEGLLSKQFACNISVENRKGATEHGQNGRSEWNEGSDDVHTPNCSNRNVSEARQKQSNVAESELKSWMRKKSSERQREFRERMEKLRALERQPFTSPGPPVTYKAIVKATEEREQRKKETAAVHFQARKEEALRLLNDLIQDKIPSPATAIPTSITTSSLHNDKRSIRTEDSKKEAADIHNRTYILNKGLIPVKTFRDRQIKPSQNSSPSKHDTRQYPIRTPVSHTGRLKSLDGGPREPFKLTPVKMSDHIHQQPNISRSSSCDTISSWSLPDDVHRILYGSSSAHFPDFADERRDAESWDETNDCEHS